MMDVKLLSQYTGVSEKVLNDFMRMSGKQIIRNDLFIEILRGVDKDLLEATLPAAREAYESRLPAFSASLSNRYGLTDTPMSAYTLGNWVVGALQFPEYLDTILEMHNGIAAEVFVGGLPELLDIVENVPRAGSEWQKALSIMAIPLMRS